MIATKTSAKPLSNTKINLIIVAFFLAVSLIGYGLERVNGGTIETLISLEK